MGLLKRNDQSSGQKLISKHDFPHGYVSFDDGDEVAPGRLGTVVIFDRATCTAAAASVAATNTAAATSATTPTTNDNSNNRYPCGALQYNYV